MAVTSSDKAKPPVITENDLMIFKIINLFGYVDRYFVEELLCPSKSKRYMQFKVAGLLKFGYLEKEYAFFPREINPNQQEKYSVYRLGDKAIKMLQKYMQVGTHSKKDSVLHGTLMAHACMLSRTVMELCISLESQQFEIVDIYNDRGNFNVETLIQPDATIVFATPTDPVRFGAIYIEMERNYKNINELTKKLIRYSSAINNKKFDSVLGHPIVDSRLIYICSNISMKDDLVGKLKQIDVTGVKVLVSSYEELCLNKLDTEYEQPYASEKTKLVRKVE